MGDPLDCQRSKVTPGLFFHRYRNPKISPWMKKWPWRETTLDMDSFLKVLQDHGVLGPAEGFGRHQDPNVMMEDYRGFSGFRYRLLHSRVQVPKRDLRGNELPLLNKGLVFHGTHGQSLAGIACAGCLYESNSESGYTESTTVGVYCVPADQIGGAVGQSPFHRIVLCTNLGANPSVSERQRVVSELDDACEGYVKFVIQGIQRGDSRKESSYGYDNQGRPITQRVLASRDFEAQYLLAVTGEGEGPVVPKTFADRHVTLRFRPELVGNFDGVWGMDLLDDMTEVQTVQLWK